MKNNMKRIMILICACFLTLSFAKEQTTKVSLEIHKNFNSRVPTPGEYNNIDIELIEHFKRAPDKISKFIEEMKIHELTEFIFSLVRSINKYLEQKAPWKTYKEYPNQAEITATTL